MSSQGREPEPYRPLTRRRALMVALLGVATGIVAVLLLTERPGRQPVVRVAPPEPVVCADGRGSGCVGGTAAVIVVPASGAQR